MTPIAQYKKALRKHLHCNKRIQKQLLKQFDLSTENFLDEHPSSGQQELITAFGTPENMASILMETVPPEQRQRYRRGKLVLMICGGMLAGLLLLSTMYIFFFKAAPVVCYDEVEVCPIRELPEANN